MLEKLLGKYYKWLELLKYQLNVRTRFLPSYFFWIISEVMVVVFIVLVWSLSNRSDSNEILEYVILGNIFFSLTSISCAWAINFDIKRGELSSKLIKPSSTMGQYFINGMVTAFLYGISMLTILIPLAFFFSEYLSWSPFFYYLIPFLIIAGSIRFFVEFIIGSTTFWLFDSNGVIQSYTTILPLLAGSLIPFDILGPAFQFLKYTPFSFTFYHPMQIYLGNYSNTQIIYTFLGALGWIVTLLVLSKTIFKYGLRKYESVGL